MGARMAPRGGAHAYDEQGQNKLLSALLNCEHVGIGLQSLICREILAENSGNPSAGDDRKLQILVPALVVVMQKGNLSLAACPTAALVNLSCGKSSTKTLLM